MRRSRGYAPFPVTLPRALPQVLACGAELKNTFCLTRDANAFLSQHIGDLENIETLEHFEASVELYKKPFRLQPEVVAYDLHPEYLSTKYALAQRRRGAGGDRRAASPRACRRVSGRERSHGAGDRREHGRPGLRRRRAPVGRRGAGLRLLGYQRVAHLEYLPLPGGELAIERPARTAAGWLLALLGERRWSAARGARPRIGDAEVAAVAAGGRRRERAAHVELRPAVRRCGRPGRPAQAVTYEGQAAIELEMVSAAGAEPYPYEIDGELR